MLQISHVNSPGLLANSGVPMSCAALNALLDSAAYS